MWTPFQIIYESLNIDGMNRDSLVLIISFFLISICSCAQQPIGNSTYLCDTTEHLFLRTNDIKAKKLLVTSPRVIHFYEGTNFYYPAYSAIFWMKNRQLKNVFILNDEFGKNSTKSLNAAALKSIDTDSLICILKEVSGYKTDTSWNFSHNHLLYFNFISKDSQVTFKICEDQLQFFPNKERLRYLDEIISIFRKERE
jgi:hypothetical protein